MRRGEEAGAQAAEAQRAFHHRGDGTLSVGAGDVDRRECVLGIAQAAGEFADIFQAEAYAEAVEAAEAFDEPPVVIAVLHRVAGSGSRRAAG